MPAHPLADSTLFVSLRSPFARRVRVALREHGVPHTERVVDVLAPPPELLAVNPLARVPALRTRDGEVLVESQLILDHVRAGLGAEAARSWPTDPAARRRADLVTGLALGLCEKAVALFFEGLRPEAQRDRALIDEDRAAGDRTLDALEGLLAGRAHVLGAAACAADWDLAIALSYWDLRVDRGWRARAPRLADLQARLEARESLRQTAPPPPA